MQRSRSDGVDRENSAIVQRRGDSRPGELHVEKCETSTRRTPPPEPTTERHDHEDLHQLCAQ
jgi:hypothetical protein